MASLGMGKPYPLTKENIEKHIPDKVIGNYAYGYTAKNGNGEECFYVEYVGRSDQEPLRDRIKHGINEGYKEFKFSIASTPKEAYEKECRNWHDFDGPLRRLDNKIHPDRPAGSDYKCPVCGLDPQKRQLKLVPRRFKR